MTTIQILTRNNAKTILTTLESIEFLGPKSVVIGDLGSTDITIPLCEATGVHVKRLGDIGRDEARNKLTQEGCNMALEPWETVVQGHANINKQNGCAYASILNQKMLSKETRFWTPDFCFVNHAFETLEAGTNQESGVILASKGQRDPTESLRLIERWKQKQPMSPQPYYYQACVELSLGQYDKFLQTANRFMLTSSQSSMPAIMTRYYIAYVYLRHKKKVRPALQNLNLCLCSRPLMAEFWCLMGDVYYHLLRKVEDALVFYENALILGSKRLKSDNWPMDIAKYKEYPNKMIDSCQKIIKGSGFYYDMT